MLLGMDAPVERLAISQSEMMATQSEIVARISTSPFPSTDGAGDKCRELANAESLNPGPGVDDDSAMPL